MDRTYGVSAPLSCETVFKNIFCHVIFAVLLFIFVGEVTIISSLQLGNFTMIHMQMMIMAGDTMATLSTVWTISSSWGKTS